jgi:hypothetical protein
MMSILKSLNYLSLNLLNCIQHLIRMKITGLSNHINIEEKKLMRILVIKKL